MTSSLARKLGAITNLTHGFIYFSESAATAYEELGLSRAQQYFASRGAALGTVSAGVIVATFFNFNPESVHRAIPSAWSVASPDEIQRVRMRAAGEQLAALDALGSDALAEATDLVGRIADGVDYAARPLAAANRAVEEPDEPWARLWQRISVVREWRGDAHVAVLTASAVTAVEALVLHAATGQVPKKVLIATRQWSAEEWQRAVERLVDRGLVEPDGSFTAEGAAFRDGIEQQTNELCQPLVAAVGDAATTRLVQLLKPVRAALVESGAFSRLQAAG